MKATLGSATLITVLALLATPSAADSPGAGQVKSALDRGANYLIDHQRPDGSYGTYQGDVGITALAIHALATCHRAYREEDGPFISRAVEYVLSHRQEKGGIYNEGQGLWNYKTSVSILALTALDAGRKEPLYQEIVAQAADFIAGLQCSDESRPLPFDREKHKRTYGGIGYGSDRRPDLSNTQFALEALVAAGYADDSDVFKNVQVFLERCQNHPRNDHLDGKEAKSTGDGGFFYAPGETKADKVTNADGSVSYSSYGSMTYAGLKSYIYAGLDRNDPRVEVAWKWILANYTLEENPGMATPLKKSRGQMGLYYYYMVLARTLDVMDVAIIETPDGKKHDWARELAAKLLELQQPDGSWVNPVDRWWEGDPAIPTAYALRALSICYDRMNRKPDTEEKQ